MEDKREISSGAEKVENIEKTSQNSANKPEKTQKTAQKRTNSNNGTKKTASEKGEKSGVKKSAKKQSPKTKAVADKSNKTHKFNLKQKIAELKDKQAERKHMLKEKREERKAQAVKNKVEKEKLRAKKRLELAAIKAEKKEKKRKAVLAAKQAKKRKAIAMKQERARRKAERIERRELLKHETKAQKKKRIAAEKAAAMKLKKERKMLVAQRRKEKAEERRQRIADRRQDRANRKERRRGIGGWLAAVISLGAVTLALGTALTLVFLNNKDMTGTLSRAYEKSYYDLVGYVENIDVNLSKLRVSNSAPEQQTLLTDVAVQAELAESNIEQLPIEYNGKMHTVTFINQMADFAKSLNNKIANGEKITEKESELIDQIYAANLKLREELASLNGQIGGKYTFTNMLKGENDLVISKFSELENNTVEYPKMIYDGPFSDGLIEGENTKTAKKEISKDEAIDSFKSYFEGYNLTDIGYVGEVNGKGVSTFNFEGKTPQQKILYAQINKEDGKLVMFDMYDECETKNFEVDTCVEIAEKFLEKCGFESMKAVWINESGNVANINFAYEQDGIIVYSDLVKVKVCEEKGKVVGLEGITYVTNHKERKIESAKITEKQAVNSISQKIQVENIRKVIIPKTGMDEKLAYEIMGTYDGSTYYIYIDAKTGNETEVFKVVRTTEGTLLI